MENISMTQVLICAAGLALSTTIGSILGFFIKEVPHKWNDAILGYCAGVMLAASTIGLIVPAAESAGQLELEVSILKRRSGKMVAGSWRSDRRNAVPECSGCIHPTHAQDRRAGL